MNAMSAAAKPATEPNAVDSRKESVSSGEAEPELRYANGPAVSYPDDLCIHEIFERQAASIPEAVAVVFDGGRETRTLTYEKLDERADQLAHCLRRLGVGPDDRVGICVPRGVDMVVAVLATWKAGGAFVPLDPAYPCERLAFMLRDSAPRVLLLHADLPQPLVGELKEVLPAHVPVLDVSAPRSWGQSELLQRPSREASAPRPEHLAYVIYTSGSTGLPKGVMVEHRGLCNLAIAQPAVFAIDRTSRILQCASFSFDAWIFEMVMAFANGASLHIPEPGVIVAGGVLARVLEEHQITHATLTPGVLATLDPDASLAGVRTLVVAGEACPQSLVRRWAPGRTFINAYGPTESTIWATFHECSADAEHHPPIGRPIANTQVYLLDPEGRPVPLGVVGEIHLAGVGLARGYLNRKELTAERFIPNPFSADASARMYKTGDLARYRADGSLEFLGRNDQQVKLRGIRIELGEIEAQLREHPAVREGVLLAREDSPGLKQLVAYVSLHAGAFERLENALVHEHVAAWADVSRDTYTGTRNEGEPRAVELLAPSVEGEPQHDPSFDYRGWNSSYTRMPMGSSEMRDWLSHTVQRIRDLEPRRVLEIGCGTGMILFGLAPHCQYYLGTDLSREMVDRVERRLASDDRLRGQAHVVHAEAADFTKVPREGFDTVLLNSVVQYFPSLAYLEGVIHMALASMGERGHIFLGDIRHRALLEVFHLSVQLSRADGDALVSELASRVAQGVLSETELAVHPAWFVALQARFPRIQHVQVLPRQDRYQHEMSAFRYDVVISVGPARQEDVAARCFADPKAEPGRAEVPCAPEEWIDARELAFDVGELERVVAASSATVVGIRSIANSRMAADSAALEVLRQGECASVQDLRQRAAAHGAKGISCSQLVAWCAEQGYSLQMSWFPCEDDGAFHAIVSKRGPTGQFDWRTLSDRSGHGRPQETAHANDPLRARRTAAVSRQLRAHLTARLPEAMVPSAFVWMERFPLTPNGKLDRKALPAPEKGACLLVEYEEPSGPVERVVAKAWAELLQLDRVGRHDHFFELGGHSLLAMQLMERLRHLGLHADVRAFFAEPTVAALAGRAATVETLGPGHVPVPPNAIPACASSILPEMLPLIELDALEIEQIVSAVPGGSANVQDIYPLAPLQQGILFHHLLQERGDAYLLSTLLAFESREQMDEVLRALQRVIDRHDALRTMFVWDNLDEPVQVVLRRARLELEILSLDSAEALRAHADASHFRLDAREAPLMRAFAAYDRRLGRWVLLLVQHHLVMDHVTGDAMLQEVALIRAGREHELPPPVPFRNFVAQSRLGVSTAEHEKFFRGMLGEVDHPTAPFGLMNVRGDGSGVREAQLLVAAPLSGRIRRQVRALGVSAATLFHWAWALVLAKTTGRDDVVFGTVLFGRMHGGSGADQGMGLFINTLPIRVDVGRGGTADGIRRVHKDLTDLVWHEHAPLALAQRCSALPSGRPLFSSLLNYYYDAKATAFRPNPVGGWGEGVELISFEERTSYPFSLSVNDLGQDFRLVAHVAEPIEPSRICEYMQHALQSVVDALELAPQAPAWRLSVLGDAELEKVVHEWNDTERRFPRLPVHRLFQEQAERAPLAPAVVHGQASVAYGELNRSANRLAHWLLASGVGRGDAVAVVLERSIELIVAQLAVLKCGAFFVPLDPSVPRERLAWLIQDSQARAVMSLSRYGDILAQGGVRIDLDRGDWRGQPDVDPEIAVSADEAAYAMYTSGSTGKPKGVVVPHRAIARLVLNNGYAAWNDTDRVAFASNPSFDASTMEVWAPLLHGGRVIVIDPADVLDPLRLRHVLRREAVTILWLTVGLFHQYADDLRDEIVRLRYLIVGGDALDPRVVERVLRNGPPQHLLNGYGPTETTTFALTHEIRDVAPQAQSIPIGRPIGNTRAYVLDGHGHPAPVGVVGELYIGGDGVALGYLNHPEWTSERFLPNPFVAVPGSRMYRTGDLGRWRADGVMEFIGRTDGQVKIRGFRVEVGEIEAYLERMPEVRDALVVARTDAPGEKRLVAYLVRGTVTAGELGAPFDPARLREKLLRELPEYMVPAAFVTLDALPLTANGKVDRQALPAPEVSAYVQRPYEAPSGDRENAIARIWEEVLGVDRVGRYDHFFELGGHSLAAVRMMSRLRQRLGAEVTLADLFASPVFSQFVGITAERTAGVGQAEGGAQRIAGPRPETPPTSLAQRRLWFLAQMNSRASAAYHVPGGMRLCGHLDVRALKAALDRIVARHEALRTGFAVVDGQPVQRIRERAEFGWVQHDLSSESASHTDQETQLTDLTRLEIEGPFDISSGPLVRGRLVRLGEDEHVLLWTMHHIVSDGWSLGVMTRELGSLYRAYAVDGVAYDVDPLPALPMQYADYAVWQRQWLSGDVLERQLGYWSQRLMGAPAVVTLPTDRPRPSVQDYDGQSVPVRFGRDLTSRLKALSQKHGTTLFMTVLAAWGTLVARLAVQDEVVIGTPVANRTRAELEPLIGFFVNTLALRLDFSANPRVGELLAQVRERTVEAQSHQDVPFEQVVETLHPQRTLAHSPIFQVMLAWQNTPGQPLELDGLCLSPVALKPTSAQFDLTLNLEEEEGEIAGDAQFASALFERATVERYVRYLQALLGGMVRDDTQRVRGVDILDAAERHQVLEQWNDTRRAYSRDRCVHELFELQADRTPDATAVEWEGGSLCYRGLDERANQLAHHLRALGVRPDQRVGVCLERGLDMAVALLAVLKAGGAYVPLEPTYPSERLVAMLRDSAASVLITHAHLLARCFSQAPCGLSILNLDAPEPEWQKASKSRPDGASVGLTTRHLAYVIYTSGSTGQPKGVMNEHLAVANRLCWMQDEHRIGPRDAVLQKTPFGFDVSVWEFFWPLMTGARLVMARPEGHKDPSYLARTIQQHGITTIHFVPSMLQAFVDCGGTTECRTIARVICSGEALSGALARRARECLPQARLYNLYGPTEAAVDVTSWACDAAELPDNIPIGRPIANTMIYLLDREGHPVPRGVSGEIYIGGIQVARGYLNLPDLTRERFVPDPFAVDPAARMYKTGDLGRWLPNGAVEFLGRNDHQVKIRGFRIELGEIELQVRRVPGVRECAVIVREDDPGEKRIVAYIVGAPPEFRSVRQMLAQTLPEYMVPIAYVVLESLPLTTSGKLDRRALPKPEEADYVLRDYEAPQGLIETTIAAIWEDLLHKERISRHDHFFELGGHSLLAVQMTAQLGQRLGVDVPIADLFAQPVLCAFAELASRADASRLPPIRPADRLGSEFPVSFAQQRLWILTQLGDAASAAYHMAGGLRLRGCLDVAALKAALDRIVLRHEVLRTRFRLVDGQPMQRIEAHGEFAWLVKDLREVDDPASQIADDGRVEAQMLFDLTEGPLIRGRLLRIADDDHVLLLTLHHIISDGWSLGVLARELGALYRAYGLEGTATDFDPLPALPVQYVDYAIWQRQWLTGELQRRQLAYWKEQLAGAPWLVSLPMDRARPAIQDYAGECLAVQFDSALVARLKALSQKHRTTLFMTLLAAWGALVCRLSGQDEVVIGTPVANRTLPEIEPLIGCFVNTLALRVDLRGSPTVADLLGRVRQCTLDAQDHRDVPFEQVVEALNPPRSLAHSPIFQLLFAWQNTLEERLDLSGLSVSPVAEGYQGAPFDLTLSLDIARAQGSRAGLEADSRPGGDPEDGAQAVVGTLRFSTALFDRPTIERHLGYFEALLREMVRDDTQPVEGIAILSEDERNLVLERWNDTAAPYSRGLLLHELFERQVEETPDAVAVQCEAATFSYRELNERANRLAHHLRAFGVGPDERVAICAHRNSHMVVGLLAVLKAGGAYVPLDPSYPRERLNCMIRDARPSALLAESHSRACLDAPVELPVMELDAQCPPWGARSPDNLGNLAARLTSECLAYVIYTSGSTGQPKGAMNEHRGIVNRLLWMQEVYRLHSRDAVLQKTPFSFDVSVWEFFWPLIAGARLVMARPEGHKDPSYLAETIRRHGITTVHFVPSMLQTFLDSGRAGECGSLSRVICSGEALSGQIVRRFKECLPHCSLQNLYGPTEAAVDVTAWSCDGENPPDNIPIGKPIANTSVYVLDRNGNPTPVGVVGEIHIAGVQVARGYLNRPDLTRERFVPDPFREGRELESRPRMYKTGDLGRWLPDGNIEFTGRNDSQVKIRGLRIELGEIEARLMKVPGVRDAVVIARGDSAGDKRLIAYVVGELPPIGEVRDLLARGLPDYMVPAAYVAVDAFPVTPNGKLDRKALPNPDTAAYARREFEAPQGRIECAIARIWTDLLRVERVGRHDHFFELGGHSLLAVQVIERLRSEHLDADIRSLFAEPTIAALAQATRPAPRDRAAIVDVPPNGIPTGCEAIEPHMLPLVALDAAQIARIVRTVPGGAANVKDIYPLAPLQQGILFHHLMQSHGDTYLLSTMFAFDTKELLDGFVRALDAVIERHDALRTAVFWEELDEPVQIVWRKAPLEVETLSSLDGDVATQLRAHGDPEHVRLDLRRAPLMRAFVAFDGARERWLLLLLQHHLVMDHMTGELMLKEMSLIHRGRRSELAEPGSYRNFVAQARFAVASRHHEAFFEQMLGDVEETTAPFGLSDVRGGRADIQEARRDLEPALAMRIRAQARLLGVSPASLFHWAWAAVLARTSGRDDVVFGTVLFGRMHAEGSVDNTLGLFINTLPIRTRLGQGTVREGVRSTHESLTQLVWHEHAPLALAQRCSALPVGQPLFSALLNYRYQSATSDLTRVRGWEAGVELLYAEERTNYPLALSVDDRGEAFRVTAQVARPVEPERVCEAMAQALEQVTRALERSGDAPASSIEILSDADRARLLFEWNDTRKPFPQECIHRLFETQAARSPERPAVVHGQQSVNYGELDRAANRLAVRLVALGVRPGDAVAILLKRSIPLVIAELAALKCGACYVPLDHHAPAERQAYQLRDCAAKVLIASAAFEGPKIDGLVRVEVEDQRACDTPERAPDARASADSTAYVMYTSGSTGRPKGVMVPHRAIARLVIDNGYAAFDETDRVAFASNPAFDATTMEVWAPLLHGGCVVVIDGDDLLDPHRLAGVLRRSSVTTLFLTTALFNQYALAIPEALARLRYLLCGGERSDPTSFGRVLEHGGPEHLIHCYGPTETTTFATTCEVAKVSADSTTVPIGRPIGNTTLYLLDHRREPVPIGVPGEIYLGGDGLASGYLNLPDLTRERFVPNPFADGPDARMYKTGDIGRWLPDGTVEFLGRNDHQLKIRGFRIELGEIEVQLLRVPGVREAVVLGWDDGLGDKRLVAYVVGSLPEVASVRATLGQSLPEYMVPSAFVVLDRLPLNANGKLDRKALPAPERALLARQHYEAPQGHVETTLASAWSELLHLETVGRQDHFFELGGHSLLAVQLMERLRREGIAADIRSLFAAPTLALFAEAIARPEARVQLEVPIPANGIPLGCTKISPEMLALVDLDERQIEHIAAHIPGGAANIQDVYPLAPLQEGLLFHHLLQRDGDAYLLSTTLAFDSRARLDGFVKALDRVIARHDVLRTSLWWDGLEEPVQVVWRHAPLDVEILDVDERAGDHEAGSVEATLAQFAEARHVRLDVRRAPLVRGYAAFDPVSRNWLLLLLQHHLVMDHVTGELIVEEMAKIHAGREHELPPPVPFRNFVAQARLGVSAKEHEEFFRTMLRDVQEPTAPFGLGNVRGDGVQIREARVALTSELSTRVRTLARRLGVGAASVFHWAWAQVLAQTTGRADVVFGTVLFGRAHAGAGADRAMGLFINTLPLRLDVGQGRVEQGIRKTHDLLAQLVWHEHAPLALAQRCSGVPSSQPLFTALLNYRHMSAKADLAATPEWRDGVRVMSGKERSNYPFNLSVDDCGEEFRLVTQIAEPISADRVAEYVSVALRQVVEACERTPDAPATSIEVLGQTERVDLLERWNATQRPYPQACIHELFEAYVEKTPERVAVVCGRQSVTYRELHTRANRLAHYLRDIGVGPDERVAICVPRSIDMVVAVLAVWKAGGAYVPIDATYPMDRIAYMVHDSAPAALLTHTSVSTAVRHRLREALAGAAPLVELDAGASRWAGKPQGTPSRHAIGLRPDHLAYVIYTSGSTGEPKGTMVEHRGLCNLAVAQSLAFQIHEDSRVLQCASFSFDACAFELVMALCHGASLHVPEAGPVMAGIALTRVLAEHAITHATLTPGVLAALDDDATLSGVKTLVVAGEACSQALVERWAPGRQFINAYGPTETTIWATFHECGSPTARPPAIGRPIANTRVYVLDSSLRPVPVGVVGELYVAGAGLARGYLNRPELTSERFVRDPFTKESNARMYKTGDLARFLTDGNLEFIGRNDQQVKIRGFRIELGEIEAHLVRIPGVREAVAAVREDRPGDKRLVAYLVGTPPEVADLRAALARDLPEYMVPAAYVAMDRLPLTPNGKLDRGVLPAPEAAAYAQSEYVAPQGATENRLAAMWAELLKLNRVGRHDHFFDIGGHSLLVTQLMSRIRQEWELEIPMTELFVHPTLSEFSTVIVDYELESLEPEQLESLMSQ